MSRPLQNRVLPTGEIVAQSARGTWMGNRGGRIHGPDRRLTRRRWASKQWIICVLSFKDRQRQVMGDGYTELFFLDEVTALAAGHRPCFECQRPRALAFAHAFPGAGRQAAPAMDAVLHKERLGQRVKARASELPEGAMVLWQEAIWARATDQMLRWSPEGYVDAAPLPESTVTVLTPPATCAALRAGFAASWHPSRAAFQV